MNDYIAKRGYRRKSEEERNTKGLCRDCPNPVNNEMFCAQCKLRRKNNKLKQKAHRKENKLCTICGEPNTRKGTLCVKHYLKDISKSHLGHGNRYKELLDLMERQEWKCALTGIPIKFEDELHLDHIIPKSKGGTNDISNLRWVLREANQSKGDLLDEEMKTLFTKILDSMNGYQKIYFWKVEYVYADQIFKTEQIAIPNVGDFIYLWDEEFRILSVRYYPERGIVYVSLTKGYYL